MAAKKSICVPLKLGVYLLLQVNHWACTGGLPTVVSVEQLNPLEGTELLLPANAVCLLVFVAAELRR